MVQHNFSDTKLSKLNYTASNAAMTVNCELENISTVHSQYLPSGTRKNQREAYESFTSRSHGLNPGRGKIYSPFWKCRDRVWSSIIILLSVCGVSFRDSRRDMKLLPTPSRPEVESEWIFTTTTYLLTYSMEQSPSWKANWFLQLVKKFHAFLEPEGSSPYPQAPATCPYPEPTPSSPHNSLPLPKDPS